MSPILTFFFAFYAILTEFADWHVFRSGQRKLKYFYVS